MKKLANFKKVKDPGEINVRTILARTPEIILPLEVEHGWSVIQNDRNRQKTGGLTNLNTFSLRAQIN